MGRDSDATSQAGGGNVGGTRGNGGDMNLNTNLPSNPSLANMSMADLEALSQETEQGSFGINQEIFGAASLAGGPLMGLIAGLLAGSTQNLSAPGTAQDATNSLTGGTSTNIGGLNSSGGGSVDGRPTLQQQIQAMLTGNPITDAASIQSNAYTQGQELLAPYLNAGTSALPALSASATPGGMDDMLSQILNGDNFQSLVDERQRGIQGQLAAGGLTRSGTAMQAAADVPTDLAFQLEGLLNGRNQNLVNQGNNAALSTSSLITGGAEATASGILGNHQQNINQQNIDDQNNNALIASVISLFGN